MEAEGVDWKSTYVLKITHHGRYLEVLNRGLNLACVQTEEVGASTQAT